MKRRFWTPAEDAALTARYPHERSADLAVALNRTLSQVHNRAWYLGLRKTRAAKAAMQARNMADRSHPGRATQFKTGQAVWNKGRKGYQPGGRAKETQFKPGAKPHTWNPIGHERVIKGGYLQRKMRDTGVTRHDYDFVHHLVWIDAGREIPAGMRLVFKDGNKRNFALDNLELVSMAELMRRNSVHNHGPEIFRLYQLTGAIQRQINRRTPKGETA